MYNSMTKEEKIELLKKEYIIGHKSFHELAQQLSTYPNKLRRDAKKFGLEIRNKSEAQAIALKTGRANHPTKGQIRPETTRIKISEGKATAWQNLSQAQKDAFADTAKKNWDNRPAKDKKEFHRKAAIAVRQTAKDGSKLEKYIFQKLIERGYKVEFHKEHLIVNDKLQIDIFLPSLNIAIEIDGPSHLVPIWGGKILNRNKRSDAQKNGLLFSKGFYVVRIKYKKTLSDKNKRDIFDKLLSVIQEITNHTTTKRYFEL